MIEYPDQNDTILPRIVEKRLFVKQLPKLSPPPNQSAA